jgi:dephospho-CoA kinase
MNRSIITVGLTGGIGSGKTTVAAIFERCGTAIIYADRVARNLIDSNKAIRKKIIQTFGKESYFPDGSLDRVRMAGRVFKNRKMQEILNAIVHPVVIREINLTIENIRRSGLYKIVIIEAALIFEAGIQNKFDYIVVVDADRDVRIRRMMLRDGESETNINARIKSQLSNRTKATMADFVIQNNGTIPDLETSTRFVYRLLMQSL